MENLYKKLKVGKIELAGNLFLAPLAGYTDRIYRSICLKHGANLAYTEMVSAEGVFRNSENTLELMKRADGEKNLAVQLFMSDAPTAKKAIVNVMKYNPQLIDINCGCPVPKVTKTGSGSALLRNSDEIYRIVKVLVEGTGVPVTVKIRTGWDTASINYLENAQAAFSAGASALCMHARTKSQLYMPSAHWEHLIALKKNFPDKIIIGSGDLFTAEDGKRMLQETGVDAIAYARGAIGNPFIFAQTKNILENKENLVISTEEKTKQIFVHLEGLCSIMGETKACREMRKHVCAYLKGIPNSSKVRNAVTVAETCDQYKKALELLF